MLNFIDFQTYLNKSKVVCFGTESNKKSNFGRRKRKYIENLTKSERGKDAAKALKRESVKNTENFT